VHSGQPKPNLRWKRKEINGLEGLLEIVGLEVMAEAITFVWFQMFEPKIKKNDKSMFFFPQKN